MSLPAELGVDDILSQVSELERMEPQGLLALAIEHYSPNVAISFSGAEDVVLIDMAVQAASRPFRVFTLDTGRLHPETYQFLERVQERYNLRVEIFFPQPRAVERLVREKGLFSFYLDGHAECCGVRKTEPLRRALAPLAAWVTGQRRDQSPATRARVPVVEQDPNFSAPGHLLVKFNPLASWNSARVWNYIREHDVPYNSLHERGFTSIGCHPCTRPVLPGQHEREGRWWWEDSNSKECGIHARQALRLPEPPSQRRPCDD